VEEQATATQVAAPVPDALRRFIWDIQSMVELADSEREILLIGRDLMSRLVATDTWLPTVFAKPDPTRCQQFQLYRDDQERFSVVATILAGAQIFPIMQDNVWEIMGVLRGAIERTLFAVPEAGSPEPKRAPGIIAAGTVATMSTQGGEAVRLRNAQPDGVSIAIHVYGGEPGALTRRAFMDDGTVIEGSVDYANADDAPPYDILSIQTRIVD
jgi:3-mercaptopropionate dioxygenase